MKSATESKELSSCGIGSANLIIEGLFKNGFWLGQDISPIIERSIREFYQAGL